MRRFACESRHVQDVFFVPMSSGESRVQPTLGSSLRLWLDSQLDKRAVCGAVMPVTLTQAIHRARVQDRFHAHRTSEIDRIALCRPKGANRT